MRIAQYLVLSFALAACATGDLRESQDDDGSSELEDARPLDVGGGSRDIGGVMDTGRDISLPDTGADASVPDSTTDPDTTPGCPGSTTDCGGNSRTLPNSKPRETPKAPCRASDDRIVTPPRSA